MPPSPPIPTICTPRLLLRAPRLDDFDACFAAWTHPQVTRFIGGRPSTGEEVWSRLLRYVGHWTVFGYGFWVVEECASGEWVGEVGFGDFHRDMEPPIGASPEMGWVLAPTAHGRGYATEAVLAAAQWGDAQFGGARTACIIHPDNTASQRVAAKVGFVEKLRTLYKGEPTIVYERQPITSAT